MIFLPSLIVVLEFKYILSSVQFKKKQRLSSTNGSLKAGKHATPTPRLNKIKNLVLITAISLSDSSKSYWGCLMISPTSYVALYGVSEFTSKQFDEYVSVSFEDCKYAGAFANYTNRHSTYRFLEI